ncbi:hypothetical protein [Vibrio crassostreae]|uniref:hypothetical protein n=1 Tax=Vibrio crassostreae TaxID=246167 RepID=UPI000F5087F6|nr:hypothetical protein [Vibrio crassostreae]RPF25107.1 hypothetical protein EDB12_0077 [Vibrio crassostreae]
MKELFNALTQATANRLKSPILGSFILSWIAVNHKVILTFIFSDSAGKIALLSDPSPFWTISPIWYTSPLAMQFAYPCFLAIVYTFGLPWIQHHLDGKKHKFIDEERAEAHYGRLKTLYTCQGDVARAQASSSLEYWREKLNRDLDDWDSQRNEYEARLANMTTELEKTTTSLGEVMSEKEVLSQGANQFEGMIEQLTLNSDHLLKENSELKNTLKNQQEQLLSYQAMAEELTVKDGELQQMKLNHKALEDSIIKSYNGYTELRTRASEAVNRILSTSTTLSDGSIRTALGDFNDALNESKFDWKMHKVVVSNIQNRRNSQEFESNGRLIPISESSNPDIARLNDHSMVNKYLNDTLNHEATQSDFFEDDFKQQSFFKAT